MSAGSAELTRVVKSLSELEKDLDEFGVLVERLRRQILDNARKEGLKLKEELLSEVEKLQQKLTEEARVEAERQAQEVIRLGEEEARKVGQRVSERFEEAVTLAMEVLLGRRRLQ